MSSDIEKIPPEIREHLWEVTRTSGLPQTEESYGKIARSWLEKERLFESQTRALGMMEVASFRIDDERGAIMLTASGSLLSLGTLSGGTRWGEYASITIRGNVPELGLSSEARIVDDAVVGMSLSFETGPIRKTSAIYKIAVCPFEVSVEEQERRVREGTRYLAHAFVKVNRTIEFPPEMPPKCTQRAIVAHLASRHNLPQKQIKEIMEDYLIVVEAGMLRGERVPLGKIGKLYLRKKPAQKARLTRNPATGEEMMVDAKSSTTLPRMSFSRYMKERAAGVEMEKGT